MSKDLYERCRRCCVKNKCNVAIQPGSVICNMNRLNSEMTHGDEDDKRRCPHCGRVID